MVSYKFFTIFVISLFSKVYCINIRQAWNGVAPEEQRGVLAVRTDSSIKECIWTLGRNEYSSEGSRRNDGVSVERLETDTLCKLTIDRATSREFAGDWNVEIIGNCWDDDSSQNTARGSRSKRQLDDAVITDGSGSNPLDTFPESKPTVFAKNVDFFSTGNILQSGTVFRPRNLGARRRYSSPNPLCVGCQNVGFTRGSIANKGNKVKSVCNNSASRKRIQLKVVAEDSIDVFPGQEELSGAKGEEVILSARTNAKPTLCKVRRGRDDVVEASGGDFEKCNKFGGDDVCTERYEKDGVFACQVRIPRMMKDHEGDWTIDVEHEGSARSGRGGRPLTGSAKIRLNYAEKPTETTLRVGKDSYTGENTRDTLELQTGTETVDCIAKGGDPDPTFEVRIDGATVDAVEGKCTGDRSSVCMSYEFDVDETMDGKLISCFAFISDVPPLQDIRRRDQGNVASIRLKVTAGSKRGTGSTNRGSSSSGRGGRNKPTLTCVDDDRVTICADGVRVGGEVEIEVQFDSDPEPTKLEWTMQESKGRSTRVTEGNAKGSYVSYVIEEDSKTSNRYVAALTIEKASADDLDTDDNHLLTVENDNGKSEFLITISTAKRCVATQTIGKGSSSSRCSSTSSGSNRGSSSGSGSRGRGYTCSVDDDTDCRCDTRGRECCDAARRCSGEDCCEACGRNDDCSLCDSRGRDCMKLAKSEDVTKTTTYDCDPRKDTDCICRGSFCCDNARRCTGDTCCQTCRDGDADCECDRSGRDCVLVNTGSSSDIVKACQLPKEIGSCRAAIQRWFYNTDTNACEVFNYGGCSGNENNFETEQDCKDKCQAESNGVQYKATKILLDSCLKLSQTLLEVYSPDGSKRSGSQTDRQFKTDLQDFFNTAKCTGYDDDILDYIDNRRTSPLIKATDRTDDLTVSFQSHKLNKVHLVNKDEKPNGKDLVALALDIQNNSEGVPEEDTTTTES